MTEDAFQLNLRRSFQLLGNALELFHGEPEPAHTGVNLEMHGYSSGKPYTLRGPRESFELVDMRQCGRERVMQDIFFFASPRAHQNEHASSNTRLAQRHAFIGR